MSASKKRNSLASDAVENGIRGAEPTTGISDGADAACKGSPWGVAAAVAAWWGGGAFATSAPVLLAGVAASDDEDGGGEDDGGCSPLAAAAAAAMAGAELDIEGPGGSRENTNQFDSISLRSAMRSGCVIEKGSRDITYGGELK